MSTNKNFVVKNGLDVGTTTVIDSAGKVDFAAIKNKPTTIAGYGITDGGGAGSLTPTFEKVTIQRANSTNVGIQFNGTGMATNSYNHFLNAANDTGDKLVIFVNGSARNQDGPANSVTIRNDGGAFRLGNQSFITDLYGSGIYANGNAIVTNNTSQLLVFSSTTYGHDWGKAAIQIRETALVAGAQSDWGYAPKLSFHWGTRTACVITLESDGRLRFRNDNGQGFASTEAQEVYSNGWFRTKGNSGWHNENYGGGIWMADTTFIRTYGSKAFFVEGSDFYCSGNVAAFYSDMRLKTKLGDIENPLEKVKRLSGFYYVPNAVARSHGYEDNKVQLGLSAQEVQAVFPELIQLAPFDMESDANGGKQSKSGENYMTLDYGRLTPVLIEAIKEQDGIVRQQAAQIESLFEMVNTLKNELNQLKGA